MNNIINAANVLQTKLNHTELRIKNKLHDRHGASDFAAVMVLIVIVVVIGVTVFYPQLKALMEEFFKGSSDMVTSLFNRT